MSMSLPPVPQTGRHPITLSPEYERRALSRRMSADWNDPFASDSNETVRKLGKLALRRDRVDPSDAFALGDLCALLSFADAHLRVLYVGKTLIAYHRAGQQADTIAERRLADEAQNAYIEW